jgi:hypothetical protein
MNTEQLRENTGILRQIPQNQVTPPADTVRAVAQQAGEQLKQKASEATDQLKNKSSEAIQQVREQAQEFAEGRKNQLLDRLGHCSAASRKAAEQLRADNDSALAGYADTLANQIDRSTEYFRQRDVRGLIADTEDFARRQPELFFGGLFIAGLALSRFLKASARQQRSLDPGPEGHWAGHGLGENRVKGEDTLRQGAGQFPTSSSSMAALMPTPHGDPLAKGPTGPGCGCA